ncbi:hypothetical protein A6E15_10505 [Natrinema saccharevitans]|uniref:Uncharacterized protein n=1 Tax=Natrinema saccharevitans TaxID=301967 RepID=A0A1S8B1K6_9EURY|nr:hypothetical protein [Natrinema saccharevitans]OLZ42691.1 hypothetical protein A6E15_10505 [Natrinema saccharevitans]
MIAVSNESGLKGMVADEMKAQIDVADMLGDGSIEDSIDGGEIGTAVGRQFGEQFGRQLGTAVGRGVHETVAEGLEDGKELGELPAEVRTAVADAVRESISEIGGRDSLESMANGVTEGGGVEGLLEGVGGESEDSDGTESETEGGEEIDEPADSDGDPSVEEIEDLREDTLEDFLGVLSYSDLQSIAKDVGVKANLSREEMTAEIVETVTGEEADDSETEAAEAE